MARISSQTGGGNVTGSDNFTVFNDISVLGKVKNPSGSLTLSASTSILVSSASLDLLGTNRNYHITSRNSHLILSSSVGSFIHISGNLSLNLSATVDGRDVSVDGTALDNLVNSIATTENLTFIIDPVNGSDLNYTKFFDSQSEIDAHGTFASFKGAVNATPRRVRNLVTYLHKSGSYSVPADYFGDLASIMIDLSGGLDFNSSSSFSASFSSLMNVSSSYNGNYITMSLDPGISDDIYQGKWLKVVSGSGVGQYKVIKKHNGKYFDVAGRYSPINSSSVVEIVQAPVELHFNSKIDIEQAGKFFSNVVRDSDHDTYNAFSSGFSLGPSISFGKLCLLFSGSSRFLILRNGYYLFNGTTIKGSTLFLETAHCELNNLMLSGNGVNSNGVSMSSNSIMRGGSSESSWFIRNYASSGIAVSQLSTFAYIYKGSIANCLDAVRVLGGKVDLYSHLNSFNISRYGIHISSSYISSVNFHMNEQTNSGGFSGTLGEINLEGTTLSYNDVKNETETCVVGNKGSFIKGY